MKKNLFILLLSMCFIYPVTAIDPGEVVFSSLPINLENPSNLKSDFQSGEKIYAVAYMSQTVRAYYEHSSPNAKLDVEVFVYEKKLPLYDYQKPYDEQLTYASMRLSGKILDNKYLVIDLVPEPETTTAYSTQGLFYKEFGKKFDGPVNFAKSLSKLVSGSHTMKVVVKCYYNDAASGVFKITGDDFSMYEKLSVDLNQIAMNAGSKSAKFPEASMKNVALETQMKTAFKNSNDWKTGFIDATEILKIAIDDKDWYIRRHQISGAILHRYIRAVIAVKNKDGKCAYYRTTFQEDYIGGKFQPLKYDGVADKVLIDCSNLK